MSKFLFIKSFSSRTLIYIIAVMVHSIAETKAQLLICIVPCISTKKSPFLTVSKKPQKLMALAFFEIFFLVLSVLRKKVTYNILKFHENELS